MGKNALRILGLTGALAVMGSLSSSAQAIAKWGPQRPNFTTIVKDKGTKNNVVKVEATVNALGAAANVTSNQGPFTNSVTVQCSNGHELSHKVLKTNDPTDGSIAVFCPFGTLAQMGKGFIASR